MSLKQTAVILLSALTLAGIGCKKSGPAAPAQNYVAIDTATAGTISGTIHYQGVPPARIPIDMGQDPVCSMADSNLTEQYVIHNGGLANVFLYVKSGLGDKLYAIPTTPVVMDQKGCRYTPHVVGVRVGQPIRFTNSDSTMHNVHMTPTLGTNQAADISQAPNDTAGDVRVLAAPELMIPVRCNNHPWMEAFINVVDNPFYAVSDADGHFTIHGLPAGTYTIEAVHEVLGKQTATVTVASQQTATADFTFSGTGTAK
ncbi:carboxypeptidase regulatory-like domain-containing protein [Silvibacterium sp.]|uniref:carboxypeptidase regulatory-like domain-containing protein n=1 Tax=Silvibacterium sp. TaxID=1964179 RepID=UPI0039E52D17